MKNNLFKSSMFSGSRRRQSGYQPEDQAASQPESQAAPVRANTPDRTATRPQFTLRHNLPDRRWLAPRALLLKKLQDEDTPCLAWDSEHPEGFPLLVCVDTKAARLLHPGVAARHAAVLPEPGTCQVVPDKNGENATLAIILPPGITRAGLVNVLVTNPCRMTLKRFARLAKKLARLGHSPAHRAKRAEILTWMGQLAREYASYLAFHLQDAALNRPVLGLNGITEPMIIEAMHLGRSVREAAARLYEELCDQGFACAFSREDLEGCLQIFLKKDFNINALTPALRGKRRSTSLKHVRTMAMASAGRLPHPLPVATPDKDTGPAKKPARAAALRLAPHAAHRTRPLSVR